MIPRALLANLMISCLLGMEGGTLPAQPVPARLQDHAHASGASPAADSRVPGPAPAAGARQGRPGILVAPTRLVFDSRRRSAEVNLTNTGTAPGNYRVSLIHMEMDADGGMRELPPERVPGKLATEDLVRFAPRQVHLEPQESQAVRLQVRKPADLPDGEYKIFMVFREEPDTPEPPPVNPADPPKNISIQLTTLFGVAIPVLIRQGETAARAGLSGLALAPDGNQLTARLERTGNQSVHGDLRATFLPRSGPARVLAEINGLTVFTPNPCRNVSLALDGGAPRGGRIRLTFSLPQEQGGTLLAEGTLDLP